MACWICWTAAERSAAVAVAPMAPTAVARAWVIRLAALSSAEPVSLRYVPAVVRLVWTCVLRLSRLCRLMTCMAAMGLLLGVSNWCPRGQLLLGLGHLRLLGLELAEHLLAG